MTIREALQLGAKTLADLPSPELDAEVLLAFHLSVSREHLLAHDDEEVQNADDCQELLTLRAKNVPVAHLTGRKEFYGRDFFITPDVLVPRPDTEVLIEQALRWIDEHGVKTLADLGTGSGCIAVTLAVERPNIHVIATDISERALEVARKNATHHNVADRIQFDAADFHHDPLPQVELIVSNPPYLTSTQKDQSIQQEPEIALYADDHGMKSITSIVAAAKSIPVILECDPQQEPAVRALAKHHGKALEFYQDLAGQTRVAVLTPE